MLNRAALIVRPKQPYLDWARTLDDSGILPDPAEEETVYLIPSYEDDDEAERLLRRIYGEIFERELYGWHTDESAWPQNRTLALFRSWFQIELHSVVEDIVAGEIVDDEG